MASFGPEQERTMMHSAIYCGSTTHRRMRPARNRFTYPVYMAFLDLDDLRAGRLENWPFFSSKTPFAMTSLLRRDHMIHESPDKDLATCVRDFVHRETGNRPTGRISFMVNLRVLGVEFNPVSFYFIFNTEGTQVELIVAEVANFPWFEQHTYLVVPTPRDTNAEKSSGLQLRRFATVKKQFHVSPFLPMDPLHYKWLFSHPSDDIRVFISLCDNDVAPPLFHASMEARRVEWSAWNLLKMQLLYPLHSLWVMMAILYEAGKMFRNGFSFFPHPSGATSFLSSLVERIVTYFLVAKQFLMSARPRWRPAVA